MLLLLGGFGRPSIEANHISVWVQDRARCNSRLMSCYMIHLTFLLSLPLHTGTGTSPNRHLWRLEAYDGQWLRDPQSQKRIP